MQSRAARFASLFSSTASAAVRARACTAGTASSRLAVPRAAFAARRHPAALAAPQRGFLDKLGLGGKADAGQAAASGDAVDEDARPTAAEGTAGLRQFFDLENPLGENVVAGRAWKASELRGKSWDDLHKLWFVLLKERNLLESQRALCRRIRVRFANPERIKKVRKSQARIKAVLAERTRLYGVSAAKSNEELAQAVAELRMGQREREDGSEFAPSADELTEEADEEADGVEPVPAEAAKRA